MFFKRFFFLALFGLLLFGLFGARGRSEFDQGYSQGYVDGQRSVAQSGETTAETLPPAPIPPPDRGRPGWGWGLFPIVGLFGLLFPLGLLFLGFSLVFGRVGRRAFRRARGRGPWSHGPWHHGRWHDKGRGGHDHGSRRPYEKRPEDVEPEIRHA